MAKRILKTREDKNILLDQTENALLDSLDVTPTLLRLLVKEHVIPQGQRENIQAKPQHLQGDEVVRLLRKATLEEFFGFCRALCDRDIAKESIVNDIFNLDVDLFKPKEEATQEHAPGSAVTATPQGQAQTEAKTSQFLQPGPNMAAPTPVPGRKDVVDLTTPAADGGYGAKYKMQRKPRGRAIIFNMFKFKRIPEENGVTDFPGSQQDGEKLKNLFTELHFEASVFDNKNKEFIDREIQKEQLSEKNNDYDAFIMFVMSHGSNGKVIDANREEIDVMEDLVKPFNRANAPALANKPKIFFIHACRGEDRDVIKESGERALSVKKDLPTPHIMADMLIYYCTFEGYLAFSSPENGSSFIHSLVPLVRDMWKTNHILEILTEHTGRVNCGEARLWNQKNRVFEHHKQVPQCNSSLTKLLYFNDTM